MKRLLALTSVSLMAVFLVPSLASAQTGGVQRVQPTITSTTTPARDRTRPYTFTTTGRVVPPPIPPLCPPGATDPSYCFAVPPALVCSGIVSVRFQRGTATISTRLVLLRPDCTYRSQVSFRSRNRLRRGTFRVRARFQGNFFLLPANSSTHTVRAG